MHFFTQQKYLQINVYQILLLLLLLHFFKYYLRNVTFLSLGFSLTSKMGVTLSP